MFRQFLCTMVCIIFITNFSVIADGCEVALGTKVDSWPSFYPGNSISEAEMVVVPDGIDGLNQIIYVNGAGTHVYSTIEFFAYYSSNNYAAIWAWDWARSASAKVKVADSTGNYSVYECKKDHIATEQKKPGSGVYGDKYWQKLEESDATSVSEWKVNARYLDRDGDGKRAHELYKIKSSGLEPSSKSGGSTYPSGDFMKKDHQISNYSEKLNIIKYQNGSYFLGYGLNENKVREKWKNEVQLWDWTKKTWVLIYSYTYWSDLKYNKSSDNKSMFPWLETHKAIYKGKSNETLTMTDKPTIGFANAQITVKKYGETESKTYVLQNNTSSAPAYSAFELNSGDWEKLFLDSAHTWLVKFKD